MKGCDCEDWVKFGNRNGANVMGLRDGWEYCPFCSMALEGEAEKPERFWCEGCGGLKLTEYYKCSWCGYEKKPGEQYGKSPAMHAFDAVQEPMTLLDLAKRVSGKRQLDIAGALEEKSDFAVTMLPDMMWMSGLEEIFDEWRKL